MNDENEQQKNANSLDMYTQVDRVEEEELAEAKKKGSLLFRLWAEARAAYKETQQLRAVQEEQMRAAREEQPAEAGAGPNTAKTAAGPEAAALGSAVPGTVAPVTDAMPADNNFLQRLRAGRSLAPEQLPYDVLPKAKTPWEEAQAAQALGDEPPAQAGTPQAAEAAGTQGIAAPPAPDEPVLYASFLLTGCAPDAEQRGYFVFLQAEARKRVFDASQPKPDGTLPAIDAMCRTFLARDSFAAYVFLFPPHNGGAEITQEDIRAALAKQNVTFGIQDELIASVVEQKQYLLLFAAAVGVRGVPGQDAIITDYFSRAKHIHLVEREDHTVDYKDLNWIQHVHTGDLICEITPAVPPQDGHTVQGRTISGRMGKKIIPPAGKNTVVSEDGTQVTATQDGQVVFFAQRFCVEQLLTIATDVGSETGNVEVIGNVVIKGNVLEGFTVKATGDITVNGMVEGAVILAGGNVQVGMGMNGSSRGVLEAKGDVAAKYLENCTVSAGGLVRADSIINCTVLSDDRVAVTTGRGVIIGGSITALNGIDANIIGNCSNRTTALVLGSTPGFLAKKAEVAQHLKDMYYVQAEYEKDLKFIAREKAPSKEHQSMAADLKVRLSALKLKLTALEAEYKEMVEKQIDMPGCQICCRKLYPPAQVTFGTAAIMVREAMELCRLYYHSGEIHFGTQY